MGDHVGFILITVIVVVIVLVVIGALAPKSKARQKATSFPYRKRKTLFTAAERSFLGVLDREVAGRYRVFGKVRLGDVLAVNSGLGASERSSASNRINQKHVDFVLCDPFDLAVLAVIELDDQSHQRADRQERDGFLAAACQAAGLPLIRIPVKAGYTSAEVSAVLGSLGRPSVGELPSAAVEAGG